MNPFRFIPSLRNSLDHKLAQEVLLDITNEEKEHAGEFLRLLQVLAPDEQGFDDEGMGETNEKIEKLKGSCKVRPARRRGRTPIDGDSPPFMVEMPGFSPGRPGV